MSPHAYVLHIPQQARSGLSALAYCRKFNLTYHTFLYRRRRLESAPLIQYIHGSQMETEQMRTTVGDGYGTLKLPSGTYDNVLRYKVTVDQTIELMSGTSVLSTTTIHTIEYFWADAGYKEYLLEYAPVLLYNGAQKRRSGSYWTDPKLVGASNPSIIRLTASGNHLPADRSAFLGSDGWSFSRDGIPSMPRSPLGRLLPVARLHP